MYALLNTPSQEDIYVQHMEREKELWSTSRYYGRIRYEELMKAAKPHTGRWRFNPDSLKV